MQNPDRVIVLEDNPVNTELMRCLLEGIYPASENSDRVGFAQDFEGFSDLFRDFLSSRSNTVLLILDNQFPMAGVQGEHSKQVIDVVSKGVASALDKRVAIFPYSAAPGVIERAVVGGGDGIVLLPGGKPFDYGTFSDSIASLEKIPGFYIPSKI